MAILAQNLCLLIKQFIFVRISNNTTDFSCKHNRFFFAISEYGGVDVKNDNLEYKEYVFPHAKSLVINYIMSLPLGVTHLQVIKQVKN